METNQMTYKFASKSISIQDLNQTFLNIKKKCKNEDFSYKITIKAKRKKNSTNGSNLQSNINKHKQILMKCQNVPKKVIINDN
jgi:hypothetical protein